MKKKWKLALALFAFVMALGFFLRNTNSIQNSPRPSETAPKRTATAPAAAEPVKEDLELLESKGAVDEHSTTIRGKIRNNSQAKTYSYVQVSFTLYNSDDEQVGTAFANTNNLEPASVWSFKAVGFTPEGKRFKLAKITGF